MRSRPQLQQGKALTVDEVLAWVGPEARTIVEIGAHDGSDTFFLAELFPQATIYAFEPDPRAIAKLAARGPHPRIKAFATAIGAFDGEAEFYASGGLMPGATPAQEKRYRDGWDKSGSLRAPKNHLVTDPWVTFDQRIKVMVRRLDTWMNLHGIARIDFIWADVQGAEADMIAGAQNALAVTRYLYTEYSDDELYEGQPTLDQICASLPSFVVQKRYSSDVMLRNTALAP